jgi:hypothetical protein
LNLKVLHGKDDSKMGSRCHLALLSGVFEKWAGANDHFKISAAAIVVLTIFLGPLIWYEKEPSQSCQIGLR